MSNEARKGGKLIAAGESTNEARKEGKLAAPGESINSGGKGSRLSQGAAAPQGDGGDSDAQYVEQYSEAKTADQTSDPGIGTSSNKSGKEDLFRPGPQYDGNYNADKNVDVYGAKKAVEPSRPLIEAGREQYTAGDYNQESSLLGQNNLLIPGLAIYGDWRTAIAYNQNNGKDIAQIATRVNIDVDFKITGTERIHAFFTPLQDNNQFTRFEFGGGDGNKDFNEEFDLNPQTLFFEGDVGSIYSGLSGSAAGFDLPFTVGLFPLFLQNGIWANDAILGGAVSLTAKNSQKLGLSNYDITFFTAVDNVDNAIVNGGDFANRNNNVSNLYGVTTFIDAFGGYIEAGYGLIQGVDDQVDGQLTNFVTASYTRRYANTLSNSTRFFANFGNGDEDEGFAIISENSLISGLPSTLLPYANFFVGSGNPQPLVDGNGAGILKNVGINFETDALTGFPKLNDTGSNAYGGAVGLQYLFNLDQQLVFELATVQPFGETIAGIGTADPQYGFGVRYQIPLNNDWLFRADATYQIVDNPEVEDNFGLRAEFRRKF
ncbi:MULTISPECIES: hypothetical protein [Rhodomicrobium]|uniref:hypothetical protein n=1 Tax=Rhodomicrobium TaxID=1068 RepID=UPI001FD938C5|nr:MULTISPECIES: hypothetical protein [Rhodomicrobium]